MKTVNIDRKLIAKVFWDLRRQKRKLPPLIIPAEVKWAAEQLGWRFRHEKSF